MATLNQLREVLHRQLFRPFAPRLADGRSYTVRHPDFIAIPPGNLGLEAYLYTEGSRPDQYTSQWLDLSLVAEIVAPAESATAAAPGKPAEGHGA
jgi:hypothetical protein